MSLLLGCLMLLAPLHAEQIEPPLEFLYQPTNLLIVGTVKEINASFSRIVFQRTETLAGNPKLITQDDIDVLASQDVLRQVRVGKSYIVGYTVFASDPRNPERMIANRKGARMLNAPGLEPALFEDRPDVRKVLNLGKSEHGRESRSSLKLLLGLLGKPDPQLQNLAAVQIVFEHGLQKKIRAPDRRAIEAFVRDAKPPPSARGFLLVAAMQQPDVFGSEWWLDVAQNLVSTSPLGGYQNESKGLDGLVLQAFDVLNFSSARVPSESLSRWLRSENLNIAESALSMLRKQGLEQERAAIQTALDDLGLTPETGAFLRDHLRRLDLAKAKADAEKQGSK
ncbi:MAG: hypothetical protein ABI451_07420 [Dokdonella sp.]